MKYGWWTAWSAVMIIASLGCIAPEVNSSFNNGGASTSVGVSGDVQARAFVGRSGVAESTGSGYVITLVDDTSFTCFSTPTDPYLKIDIGMFSTEGTFSAAGSVTFATNDGVVEESESAMQGTVTISIIDEPNASISGSIDAAGLNSDVSGSFTVELCP
ncbi:MAG: hypothetical protein AAGI01_13765 [Myxococcota bacterium]